MAQTDSSTNRAQSTTKHNSIKKVTKTAFAALVSAGLVGTFALPAYSTPQSPGEVQYASQAAQTLKTIDLPEAEFDIAALAVGENVELLEAERSAEEARLEEEREEQQRALEAEQAQADQGSQQAAPAQAVASSVPAGAGASGMVGAAYSQLGIAQDCTDLVQNTLAAMGRDTRRDHGGYDRGPGLGDWTQFGTVLPGGSEILPGDILVWQGAHVAIATGGGMAVHGGVGPGGLGTAHMAVSAAFAGPVPTSIVRPN